MAALIVTVWAGLLTYLLAYYQPDWRSPPLHGRVAPR